MDITASAFLSWYRTFQHQLFLGLQVDHVASCNGDLFAGPFTPMRHWKQKSAPDSRTINLVRGLRYNFYASNVAAIYGRFPGSSGLSPSEAGFALLGSEEECAEWTQHIEIYAPGFEANHLLRQSQQLLKGQYPVIYSQREVEEKLAHFFIGRHIPGEGLININVRYIAVRLYYWRDHLVREAFEQTGVKPEGHANRWFDGTG